MKLISVSNWSVEIAIPAAGQCLLCTPQLYQTILTTVVESRVVDWLGCIGAFPGEGSLFAIDRIHFVSDPRFADCRCPYSLEDF